MAAILDQPFSICFLFAIWCPKFNKFLATRNISLFYQSQYSVGNGEKVTVERFNSHDEHAFRQIKSSCNEVFLKMSDVIM